MDYIDQPTGAPVVGDLAEGFEIRLDAANLYRLPTVAADAGALADHWLAAATITGLGHRHHGRTGQDSYAYAATHSAVVASVADGLGSRPDHAQLGAVAVSRLLCNALGDLRPDQGLGNDESLAAAVEGVNQKLHELLVNTRPDLSPRDVAATTAFAQIVRSQGRREAMIGRIGDCAAFVLNGHDWDSVFPRSAGPSNVVEALMPAQDVVAGLEIARIALSDEARLVLVTDELASDIYTSPDIREWLGTRWADPADVFHMLESLRYRRRGSHDDRTALVLWGGGADSVERDDAAADTDVGEASS